VATARHTKEVFPTVKVKVDATDVYAGKLQNFNYASHTHSILPQTERGIDLGNPFLFSQISEEQF
jgi:hypothetical protein